MPDPTLAEILGGRLDRAREKARGLSLEPRIRSAGRVIRVADGVAMVAGLPDAGLDELLMLGGTPALATALDREEVGCILLDAAETVLPGARVRGTGDVVRVPVGPELLGRVVDPLGRPLDGGPPLAGLQSDPIERLAPEIVDRAPVTEPLHTGVLVVDAMTPLGRGQRQLIVGDRKTGKTAVALDAMVRQRSTDVVSVYVAIGQKSSTVGRVVDALKKAGAFERCMVVVAEPDSAPGLQWIAPYAATTMAEYFRDRGQDALIVFDDLTRHAAVHRELSLLLRSPPGREAYPGDVFYLHSRLLERASRLAGGGSITALPIVETQAGNLTAYIPTNLVSITDGQIYLDPQLFNEGQRPAVDVGLSVSRVGGRAQSPALRELAKSLHLEYAQFLELEVFSRFGGVADDRTKKTLEHGRRMRTVLSQRELAPWGLGEEIALLLALTSGELDEVPIERLQGALPELGAHLAATCGGLLERLEAGEPLGDGDRAALLAAVRGLIGEG